MPEGQLTVDEEHEPSVRLELKRIEVRGACVLGQRI